MKPSLVAEVLRVAIRNGHNILLSGSPGVGKTDLVKQATQAEEADLIISHPVVSDPTDYKGMPWVVAMPDGTHQALFLPFSDLELLIKATKRTVFVLDDLGQAPASVQAPAMQLIYGGRINGFKISEQVVFIACTNRREDKAGVQGILEPVKSRFKSIIEVTPDLDDWARWALTNDISFEVISFNRWKGNALCDFHPTKAMTNSPCPRTWHGVSDILKANYPPESELEMVSGAIGEGMAIEFMAFVKLARELPDPDLVVLKPDEVPVPKNPSTLYALCGALTQRAGENNFSNIVKYANRLPADFSVMLIIDTLTKKKELKNTKAFIDWTLKHQEVLK